MRHSDLFERLVEQLDQYDVETARLLLPDRLGLDDLDEDGETLLNVATRHNHGACVSFLLKAGCMPSKPDGRGCLALQIACASRNSDIVNDLLKQRPNTDQGRCEIIDLSEFPATTPVANTKTLWARICGGLSPNSYYFEEQYRLVNSLVRDQNWSAVYLCIQAGLNLELLLDSEVGMLAKIIEMDQSDLIFLFLAIGADLRSWRNLDRSIIHQASQCGSGSILQLLIDAEYDVNQTTDISNETPLMLAAGAGSIECCELLLAAGSSLSTKSAGGMNALHWTVYGRNTAAVPLLVAAGIPKYETVDGMNATQIASYVSDHMVAQLYRDHGIEDEYSLPSHTSNWEPDGIFDFMISYRHNTFFDYAATLAHSLENKGFRVFIDQKHLEISPDEEVEQGELKSRLLKAVNACKCVLFFETHDRWVSDSMGDKKREINWQIFELLNCKRAALVLPEKSGCELVTKRVPGQHLGSTSVFSFSGIDQLVEGLVDHANVLIEGVPTIR